MTTERDLLRTIAREPEDDAPRLVYADWLEEHGRDDRAEFIRGQVRLAGMREDSRERREIAFRCRQLLEANEEEWAALFRDGPVEWHWSRGFVEMIDAVPEDLEGTEGEEQFDLHPIRRLILTQLGGKVDAVELIPADHRLAALELINNDLDLRALKKLVKSPHLGGLSELSLMFNRLGDTSINFLSQEPFFQRLSLLRLGCNPFSEGGRGRLREHFGDRVSFAWERFPERLYAIQDGRLRVGWGHDLVQLFLCGPDLVLFDHAGNLLSTETCPFPEVESDRSRVRYAPIWDWGDARMKDLGRESATIKVKRFQFADGVGINDFNFWANPWDDRNHPQHDEVYEWIEPWLRKGRFEIQDFMGENNWFDRSGK